MKDSTILKISMILAIFGLISMYYLSDKLEITITNIGSIDKQSIEKDVKIEGYATKITNQVNPNYRIKRFNWNNRCSHFRYYYKNPKRIISKYYWKSN